MTDEPDTIAGIALDGPATDVQALLAAIPYAQYLGVAVEPGKDGLTLVMRFQDHLIGNPVLPALHGGVIGAFLEMTAIAGLIWDAPLEALPKPVDISVDFLRSGRSVDTYARAIITKRGRRVANVRAEAWQDDRTRPVAALHGHFLIRPRGGAAG